ncbi:P-loop containing nucleoside triphosphate hydrolase protein [Mucidula mucida]|nr:P-loop containing nucleoside triphosphate hydrolase protein [Mucidula mucida]
MAPSESNLKKRKFAVLGARSVGKSSLIYQFVEGQFNENYYPTTENSCSKSLNYKGTEYDCEIIDTAGQDEYSILNSRHAIGIHGYVLVVYDKIVDFCGVTDIPCVIVGSKVDLKTRQVSPEEGEGLALSNKAAWVETSAKTNLNVAKVFDLCLGEVEKHSPSIQGEPPASRCVLM